MIPWLRTRARVISRVRRFLAKCTKRLTKDSSLILLDSCLFVPIIQWVDRTHVTGNGRFSLKPYMLGASMVTCQRRKLCQPRIGAKRKGTISAATMLN
jgi:hypothetical protein